MAVARLLHEIANTSPARLWGLLRNPAMLPVHLRAPARSSSHVALKPLMPTLADGDVAAMRLEFLGQQERIRQVNERMLATRERLFLFAVWYELLLMLVRLTRPEVIFETGVFDGRSSTVILQTMQENGSGQLVPAVGTIDGSSLPPGWLVPDPLRERYRLERGDAHELLPKLFEEYPRVDVFFHDSLHTYDHMRFEFELAWPHIPEGEVLVGDDIFCNEAFHEFCLEHARPYVCVQTIGATRK